MRGRAEETVGENFRTDLLQSARDKTLAVIEAVAAAIRPGMTELDAKRLILDKQVELGAPKNWHPPQIRFGKNTLQPFGGKSEPGVKLAENDIFFFDIGPIFDEHEGDVGRPFALGTDPEMTKCCRDAGTLWNETRHHWNAGQVTGGELYEFARKRARELGWILTLDKANGHRIADFPHCARARGSVEGHAGKPASNRWILEIQIRHPERPFGAFYEDLLN